MPIDSLHPEYEISIEKWTRIRHVIEGEDAVKGAGRTYLPDLTGQSAPEYDAYKTRSLFFGAAKRTVLGLVGAVMRKEPHLEVPPALDDIVSDIGVDGESVTQFAMKLLDEVLSTGRVGVYVDAPPKDEGAEDEILPYLTIYYPENIINWKTVRLRGRNQLSMVVLKESIEAGDGDEYRREEQTVYRVLKLVAVEEGEGEDDEVHGSSHVFVVERWIKVEGRGVREEDQWVMLDSVIPKLQGGSPLDYIPFTIVGVTGTGPKVEKSQLLDLVNVNLSHYRTSADLEHGRHFTALPTAWVAGFQVEDNAELKIGSATAWVAADPSAKAGFLEFTGAGLGSLESAMETKEKMMAVLGARLLEPQRPGVEAAESLRLRQSGEGSVLMNAALSVSEGIEIVLDWVARWYGLLETEPVFKLNTDFNVAGIDSAILTSLMQALQSGGISWDTWFYNLQRGELIPDGIDAEAERALIETSIPMATPDSGAADEEFGEEEDEEVEESPQS